MATFFVMLSSYCCLPAGEAGYRVITVPENNDNNDNA